MQWIKFAGVIVLIVAAGAAGWWVQDELWSAVGFDTPWWGYLAFWGAMALVVIVLKLTGPPAFFVPFFCTMTPLALPRLPAKGQDGRPGFRDPYSEDDPWAR